METLAVENRKLLGINDDIMEKDNDDDDSDDDDEEDEYCDGEKPKGKKRPPAKKVYMYIYLDIYMYVC
jgi:hypothetical protein